MFTKKKKMDRFDQSLDAYDFVLIYGKREKQKNKTKHNFSMYIKD